MTKIFKTDEKDLNIEQIKVCAEIIRSGGIVAFPTETVYGLGASAFNAKACEKIYIAKGRPQKKPLSCLVDSAEMAGQIAYVNNTAKKLIDIFAPGPVTLVLQKKDVVPSIVSAGTDTVAIRIPDNKITLKLIEYCAVPLAAPSANISGMTSPKCAEDVLKQLNGKIDALIDGGKCEIGVESTIISLTGNKGKILRCGAISRDIISKYIELEES